MREGPNHLATAQHDDFLPDLTRVKFGSACLPLGRRYRARPPRQALPNFHPIVSPQPPLPFAYALGQSDRSTCHWHVAQSVLWLSIFTGSFAEIPCNRLSPQ